MKKFVFSLCCLVLAGAWATAHCQTPWDGSVAEGFSSGEGSKESPYLVTDASQLAFLASEVNAGTDYEGLFLRLEADLDLGSQEWEPIGTDAAMFAGYFDGNGKTISNLKIDREDAAVNGLFGAIAASATVSGLRLDASCRISVAVSTSFSGSIHAGGVAGLSHGTIRQCSYAGELSVEAGGNTSAFGISYYAGGISGLSYGSIEECSNAGSVTCQQPETVFSSTTYAGGITGAQFNIPIRNCYNTGAVSSFPWYAGGIAGQGATEISNSYNAGSLASSWNLSGGISGLPGSSFPYAYSLEGSGANPGGGREKAKEEMQAASFADSLNAELDNAVWVADEAFLNNGYPILSWQSPQGVAVAADPSLHGRFEVYLDNKLLELPATVTPGSEIKLVARPDTGYVLNAFYTEKGPFIGNTLEVFASCTLGAEFVYSENVKLWDGSIAGSYGGGSGTETDPYLISTPEELALLARQTNEGKIAAACYFKLTNNLDLNLIEWNPAGNPDNPFRCHFDGNHKTIANLAVTADTNRFYGLFGYANPVEIKDLGIIGASFIRMAEGNGGSVAGVSHAFIRNCYSECRIEARCHLNNSFAGGICGKNGGEILNCYYNGTVSAKGSAMAGGLAAENLAQGVVRCSYLAGEAESERIASSGAGCVYDQGIMEHCYYVEGSCPNPGGATMKTVSEMQDPAFPDSLNQEQVSRPWMAGMVESGNGFPVLKWQAGAIFPVFIVQPGYGEIRAYVAGKALKSGDKVEWEQEIDLSEEPDPDHIIDYFITDSVKIYGKSACVYDTISLSASFRECPGVQAWDGSVATAFASGSGSFEDPYVIEAPSQLAFLAWSNNSGTDYENTYFELAGNMDMRSLDWTPIGNTVENAFKGTFNGNGFLIANLNVQALHAGLFGVVTQHCRGIERLGIAGISMVASVESGNEMVSAGAVAGMSYAPISDCFSRNACIYSSEAAGGIVGRNNGKVFNCYNTGKVVSEAFAGGMAGANNDTIGWCYNRGRVETRNLYNPWANGIAGSSFSTGHVSDCYNLLGSSLFNEDGAAGKEDWEMKTDDFAAGLNAGQETLHWATDLEPALNDGFLILKWQDPRSFAITTSCVGEGEITPTSYVSYEDSVTIRIYPAAHHFVADVEVDGISVGAVEEYTFKNVTESHAVVAYIEINTYSISVSHGPHGSVSPDTARVPHGGHAAFEMLPDEGYAVAEVRVDGVSVGNPESYTFVSVTGNHTLHADFKPEASVENGMDGEMRVYAGRGCIYVETRREGYGLRVHSAEGREIFRRVSVRGNAVVPVSASGVYVVEIRFGGNRRVEKVPVAL